MPTLIAVRLIPPRLWPVIITKDCAIKDNNMAYTARLANLTRHRLSLFRWAFVFLAAVVRAINSNNKRPDNNYIRNLKLKGPCNNLLPA